MASGQLGSNPAASAELTARYSKLFLDYRLAVNAAHFSGPTPAQQQAPSGTGATEVWEWQGPHGIRAAKHPPLPAYLAAPRLPAQLGAYLHPQQSLPRQQ